MKTGLVLCFLLGLCSLPFLLSNAQRFVLSDQEDKKSVLELTLSRSLSGHDTGYVCTPISLKTVQKHRLLSTNNNVIVNKRHVPIQSGPSASTNTDEWLQIFGYSSEILWSKAEEFCSSYVQAIDSNEGIHDIAFQQQPLTSQGTLTPPIELFPIAISGRSTNRVDITFFADGYLLEEKDKFLRDATRLAEDISYNQTFASVKPLLNFWAAFSPSQESGIGAGGVPKNTVYGLYRDGTELRAVYCSKLEVARLACLSLHSNHESKCDYPILLGNDPYYGGSGGEFTISTASEINGPLVLRHELGHSIIRIGADKGLLTASMHANAPTGEEYDGGFAYFGVNAGHNISTPQDVTWAHWLTDPQTSSTNEVRFERSNMPFQVYAWTMLNTTTPWSAKFTSSGDYARYRVRFSLSGLPSIDDLRVYLDGEDLHWEPRQGIGMDRWHYDILRDVGLTNSVHELRFELLENSLEGVAQLCSAEIIEYGDEHEFNSTEGNYGIYPTYSIDNITSYRPTDEQCLMRQVTSHNFCDVCKEGLWLSLLSRITLIDTVIFDFQNELSIVIIEIIPVPLGQFRSESGPPFTKGSIDTYSIRWEKDGLPLPQYSNLTKVVIPMNTDGILWVTLDLHTSEVRMDSNRLLRSEVGLGVKAGQPPLIRTVS